MAGACWSWKGELGHPGRDGEHTCADHAAEEERIRREVGHLESVRAALAKCAELERSTNEKRDLSEGAVGAFFSTALEGTGLEIVTGHRAPEGGDQEGTELDLVVDGRATNPGQFGPRSRHNVERVPVHAHLEVSYYSKLDPRKIEKDLTRLDRTIREAMASGVKTWTGLAYLGPVEPEQLDDVRRSLVAHYHETELHPLPTENVGDAWPVIDTMLVPGRAWMKHEYFAMASVVAERLVGFHEVPTFSDDPFRPVRPLSVARHLFSNFLRLECDEEIDTMAASYGAVLGPRSEFRRPPVVVLPCRELPRVYRKGESLSWIEHVPPIDGPRCAAGKGHVYVAADG